MSAERSATRAQAASEAFCGTGRGGSVNRLLQDRQADRNREQGVGAAAARDAAG
jgi:hypothetical protein